LYLDVYVHGDDNLFKMATSNLFQYLFNAVNKTKNGEAVDRKAPAKFVTFFSSAELIAQILSAFGDKPSTRPQDTSLILFEVYEDE